VVVTVLGKKAFGGVEQALAGFLVFGSRHGILKQVFKAYV
jgi:hypothetical protein